MVRINPKLLHTTQQERSKIIGSPLSDNLRQQYSKRGTRVIKGDTVKIMRGEYSGIEGKVEKVNTRRGALSIEGIQREKIRGGNVKVQIHASNVMITGLNLDDKYRQSILQGNKQEFKRKGHKEDKQKEAKQ